MLGRDRRARARAGRRGPRTPITCSTPDDLRALVVVLDEDADGLRVLEDVLHVARRAVRVDRGADGADEGQREVEQRPFEVRPGEQREGVALADAEGEQPVGELVHGPGSLCPGHGNPLAVDLVEVRRVGMRGRDRVPPQIRNRPGAGH